MPSCPGIFSHSSPVHDPCHLLLTSPSTFIQSPSSLSCPSGQGVQGLLAQCEECVQTKEVAAPEAVVGNQEQHCHQESWRREDSGPDNQIEVGLWTFPAKSLMNLLTAHNGGKEE